MSLKFEPRLDRTCCAWYFCPKSYLNQTHYIDKCSTFIVSLNKLRSTAAPGLTKDTQRFSISMSVLKSFLVLSRFIPVLVLVFCIWKFRPKFWRRRESRQKCTCLRNRQNCYSRNQLLQDYYNNDNLPLVQLWLQDCRRYLYELSTSGQVLLHHRNNAIHVHVIQICSGITRGRVLNGELYAQKLQICSDDWREISMKQSVNKCR